MATAKKQTKTANSNTPSGAKAANKAQETTLKAVKTTQDAADKVVTMSNEAMQQFWKHGTFEAEKTREKVLALGRESAQTWSRSADTVSQNLAEAMSISRGNVEAGVECANIASEVARDIATDMYNYSNKTFAENMEASKQVFSCRTANDFFELQHQLFRNNIESFFAQTSKLSDKFFRYSQDIAEPVQERMAETTDKINKAFSS